MGLGQYNTARSLLFFLRVGHFSSINPPLVVSVQLTLQSSGLVGFDSLAVFSPLLWGSGFLEALTVLSTFQNGFSLKYEIGS